jgi:lysophospholipase L1-like esterase
MKAKHFNAWAIAIRSRSRLPVISLFVIGLTLLSAISSGAAETDESLPTLFIIGDSTVNNPTKGLQGWGTPIALWLDQTRIHVQNRARGGRSSRTYFTEGLWDQVLAGMKPGDFVLMQFGHNDGGSLTQGRARASLKGSGDETQEIVDEKTGKKETVHTFGWYMRKYVSDAKSKHATPIVLSLIPRNIWKDDHTVVRATNDYAKWAAEAAKTEGVSFIDLNDLVASRYEQLGSEKVKTNYFGEDHTHTTPAGAEVNAATIVTGIRALKDCPLSNYLLDKPARNASSAERASTNPAAK